MTLNTPGHSYVAEHAGERPLLRPAFEDLGFPKSSLKAFYMGNWFTDVQQGVDPVAYANAIPMLKSYVQPFVGSQAWDRLEQLLHALLDAPPPPWGAKRGDWTGDEIPSWDEDSPLRRSSDEELLRQLDSRYERAVNEEADEAEDLDSKRSKLRSLLKDRDRIKADLDKTGANALDDSTRDKRERELAINTIELEQIRHRSRQSLNAGVYYKKDDGEVEPDIDSRFRVRNSNLGLILRRLMFTKGFFKFACPFDAESLDAEVYEYVFDNCFTQYYPHEHMDRPEREFYTREKLEGEEADKKDTPEWDDVEVFAREPRLLQKGEGTRSPNRKQALTPDLHTYLRDDIEIAAGLLAEIDYKWAHKYLREGAPEKPNTKDKEFHYWLARLGYALHPIEDFFAHTTFAERAVGTFGKQSELYKKWVPLDEDTTLWDKRQRLVLTPNEATAKKWKNAKKPGWEENAPTGDHVMSGFFDFRDTVVSLSHIGEHAFLKRFGTSKHHEMDLHGKDKPWELDLKKEYRVPGLESWNVPDLLVDLAQEFGEVPWVRDALHSMEVREQNEELDEQDKCTYQFKKVTTHLLDFLNDREAALNDEENELARTMFADAPRDLTPGDAAQKVVDEHPLFNESARRAGTGAQRYADLLPSDMRWVKGKKVPQSVKDAYVEYVTVMATELRPEGPLRSVPFPEVTPYRMFRWLEYVLENPASRFIEFVAGLLGAREQIEAVTKGVAEMFYNIVAASRLGCHSLIAKDHGPEGLLYMQQLNCALAVHWYVVRVMLRRLWPLPVHVCREPRDASARDKQKGTVNEHIWIDWLELLEFYLRNPSTKSAGKLEPREVLRDYRVQPGDSLGKLEDTFRSQALDPSSFSWRMIARASFNGKDKPRDVNRFLKHTKFVDKDGKLRPYGVLSGDGLNYKFTVGAPLKIPVRWDPPAMDPTDKDRAWYRAVMKDWEVIQGKERTKNGKKPSGESVCKVEPDLSFVPHVLINIKLDEVKELIDRANAMRNDACEAYMPSQKKDEKDAARKAKASPLPLRHTLERGELLTGKARRESGDEVYVCTHYAEQVLELANYEVTAEVSDAIHMPMPDEQIAPAVEAGQDRMKGVARAIAEFGLGRYVQTSELQPGDFVQYWTTRGDGVEGHCGQVMRVGPGPTTVQLHGCHRSTGLVSTIEVDLKKDVLQVYAARPKGNE